MGLKRRGDFPVALSETNPASDQALRKSSLGRGICDRQGRKPEHLESVQNNLTQLHVGDSPTVPKPRTWPEIPESRDGGFQNIQDKNKPRTIRFLCRPARSPSPQSWKPFKQSTKIPKLYRKPAEEKIKAEKFNSTQTFFDSIKMKT